MEIMQGDAYSIEVEILASDGPADPTLFDEVEIVIGKLRKTMSSGAVTYDADKKVFLFPVTQAETFSMRGSQGGQVRLKLKGTEKVVGLKLEQTSIVESRSKEEI